MMIAVFLLVLAINNGFGQSPDPEGWGGAQYVNRLNYGVILENMHFLIMQNNIGTIPSKFICLVFMILITCLIFAVAVLGQEKMVIHVIRLCVPWNICLI